ncbi:hypothetical protein SAMN05192534_11679 [Alteribacillus persepolensis]|uniref:Uncharacterized protein n=1 Tax=Alteribacillus persepolensis TaxID=568899 RepID=A0A1G8GQF5_9BACI|nr:hypothetical protein [Alteribacillus persepolensis]SDH96597.1 hypothetical protein SAMN05192534_11679 [Alteribacillus persepolensis]
MSKKNVSRCAIPVRNNKRYVYVKMKNNNVQQKPRKLTIKAYDKDSETKEALPIYYNDQLIETDTLAFEEEKIYKIDVANVKRKVVFEATQFKGGSGMSVSSKNKGAVNAEIGIK